MDLRGIKLTWLGHSAFLIETTGTTVLIDPWLKDNPSCPPNKKQVKSADIMLITHGHPDHIGDAVDIALRHNSNVVGIYELCSWLQKKGVQHVSPMNKGGTQSVADIRVTMVHAFHSSGIEDEGQIVYAGEPCGFVIEFENGLKIYHAGDTALFGDMHLIHEIYQPDIALLPIGDHYTMGPREACYACRLLRPKTAIPMHYGTFPQLTGTAEEFQRGVADLGIEVVVMRPGETRQ
jgi:L-ascorbate metabolism protein UlaG (beta-lactamase superfamily)